MAVRKKAKKKNTKKAKPVGRNVVRDTRRKNDLLDDNGRFKKGNSGGPGNPNIRALSETRQGLSKALAEFDVSHVVEILRTCYTKGIKGSHQFAKLFLVYAIGKPKQVTDVNVRGFGMLSKVQDVNPEELLKIIVGNQDDGEKKE